MDDKRIKEINKLYLKRDFSTDVIAFALQEGADIPDGNIPLIGQIIISKETALRQSKELKHPLKEEMLILLIHGLLHIAGFHEGKELTLCQKKIRKQIINY